MKTQKIKLIVFYACLRFAGKNNRNLHSFSVYWIDFGEAAFEEFSIAEKGFPGTIDVIFTKESYFELRFVRGLMPNALFIKIDSMQ